MSSNKLANDTIIISKIHDYYENLSYEEETSVSLLHILLMSDLR